MDRLVFLGPHYIPYGGTDLQYSGREVPQFPTPHLKHLLNDQLLMKVRFVYERIFM